MSLQPQAVGPELWQLLNRLMAEAELSDFYLVGGTALALHYGHRISVDIDLFTELNLMPCSQPLPYSLSGLRRAGRQHPRA
jgi:hypothetical protein